RKYGGTGMGLPLSKSLVEAHGGTLDIRSRLGHGTTVVAHFPPQRSIMVDAQPGATPDATGGADMKSPDTDAEGEVAPVSGDDSDKKTPTMH
ncbi:MAG: hypothetical protein JKY27_05640, partial [Magnetovibrio sp.]|nr:hypothetical protein [Magnetovibrio sp.]